ncbi:MAG: methyltransferase [Pseudomonadota bacterium]
MSDEKPIGTPVSELDGMVARLTAMREGDSAHSTYEAWATCYEADLVDGYGYRAHQIAASALAAHGVSMHARIADLGCGTGLVGAVLAENGFTHIDGFDASANMLAKARGKQCYNTLHEVDLTVEDGLPAAAYDAAVAVGVFGAGHIGPEHLMCFFAPVAAGGVVVLYANGIPFVQDQYQSHLAALERDGICTLLRVEQSNYMDKIERPGWLVVARRR